MARVLSMSLGIARDSMAEEKLACESIAPPSPSQHVHLPAMPTLPKKVARRLAE